MRAKKSIFRALAMLPLVGVLSLTGCSGVLPATLEQKLATRGNAEDHLAAAKVYQNKARELEAEAVQYETEASNIGPYMDPKGFTRAALRTAGQEKRLDAQEMQELYAAQLEQARTLHSKAQSE